MRLFTQRHSRIEAARRQKAKRASAMRFRPKLETLEDRQMLSAGALDPTFGNGGIASLAASNDGGARAVAVYSDAQSGTAGDVVAVNVNKQLVDFAVARYSPNGAPDSSFGNNGEVHTSFDTSHGSAGAVTVAIQTDGKVVAAGFATGTTKRGASRDFALARYNVNGSLDRTFGAGGEVTTNFSGGKTVATGSNDTVVAMLVQSDGKIVLVGSTIAPHSQIQDMALARYNANGSLDSTFGGGGKVITSHTLIPGGVDRMGSTQVLDAALQTDGKILLSGVTQRTTTAPWTFASFVARYNTNGTLDTSFGNGGFSVLSASSGGTVGMGHLAVEPNGEIVVTNMHNLVLLHADDGIDTSFADPVLSRAGDGTPSPGFVALEPDGDIVVGGGFNRVVSRFLPDGTPDATFGSGGVVTLPSSITATALAIQPDGKIDLAASSDGLAVARLLPGEPQIGSLTADVNADGSLTLTASNLSDNNPNAVVTQVAFYAEDSGGTTTLLGYGTQTSPGVWTFTARLSAGTYTLSAVAEDSYGVFGDPLGINETLN